MKSPASNRIAPVAPRQAAARTRGMLNGALAKQGFVSNLLRVFAHSPSVLKGYLSFHEALAKGAFDASLREQIALAVAEANLCGYCLSVHAFAGARSGLSASEIAAARQAAARSARSDAILKFARSIIVSRGEVSDADLAQARAAGLTDADIVETVAHVALNTWLNYMNHVARPPLDFPEVKPGVGYDDAASDDLQSGAVR